MSRLFCRLTTLRVIPAVILIYLSLPVVDTTYWDSAYRHRQRPDPGSIIKANNEVVVQRGRSVILDPFNHLLIKVQPGDQCYLTVLGHEPLAQTFGMLSPKKFPCSFKKGDVEYVHFGSQSGGMDCVKLQLRYDTRTDTIVLPLTLQVAVTPNAQRLVNLIGPLVVDKQNGASNSINSRGLAFTFTNSRCVLTPLIGTGGYPRYGSLLNYFSNSQPIDCNVFLNLGVRYILKPGTGSPKVDFVPFMVERLDNQDRKLQQEHFQFKVIIDGTAVNSPPKPSFISLMMMEVSQFVMTAITTDMLAAEDLESDPDDLVFKVVSPPEQGLIISTDNPNQPISAFYQRDLRDLKIAFKPPGEDSDSERVLHAEFKVVDQEGSTSDTFSFMIVVKPMNTLAPVVTLNAGQFLFEGQSRPLSSNLNLRISDEDNLADVRISVVHGLRHGTLTVLGSQRKFFTPDDLDAGVVMYEHDGSETFSDNIVFRMTDGKNEVEFLFPVTIILQDDEPPVVNVNTGLIMVKGETKQIFPDVLSATDVDSDNRHLKFTLVYPYSSVGQVILRQPQTPEDISSWRYSDSNHVFERVAVDWYLSDILEGKLYYRYVGPQLTATITDQFTFLVEDDNNPPNQSGEHIFYIKVHAIDDLAPEPYPGTTLRVLVQEYELTVLNKDMLHFTDLTSADKDLSYTVIFPSFNQEITPEKSLLGHFVLTDSPNTIISEFTQAQINHGKVAYNPPDQEIGVTAREIQFTFTVKDAAGNVARSRLTIVLQPVNNKPPQITNTGFNVVSKSTYTISKDVLDVTDQDTVSENITFTVIQTPNQGVLRFHGKDLTTEKIFHLSDIEADVLVYVHSGNGDSLHDQFKLDVSDGLHHVPITVRVSLRPIEPVIPVVTIHPGTLDITVEVAENGVIQITSEDHRPNSGDVSVNLTVESSPRFGVIQINKAQSNVFTLYSLMNGAVTYIHTAGEVGPARVIDSFRLNVSGKWIVNSKMIQSVMVHVSIHPVDNSPTVVHVGEQFIVREGGKNLIKEENIQARDLDTETEFIVCTIITQPSFGFVENVSPAPGYEKLRSGIAVSAFTVKDIQLGHVYYVQSVHKGTEPVEDRFTFQCTDGTNFSDRHVFPVMITPENDEEPVIFCREFVVMEGMSLTIDIPVLNAVDSDVPKDVLEFETVTGPKHGRIVQHLTNSTELIVKFSLEQIQAASSILYEHDGSETTSDTFKVRLTDGKHVVEKQVVVLILPVDDETPRLSVNNGLEVEIGERKIITNRLLKATDLDSLDSNLTFILRQTPTQGFLQHLKRVVNLTVGMNFTQNDIDKALVQYVHMGQGGVRDLVKFDVTDGTNPLVDRYFYITVGAVDKAFPTVISKGVTLPEGGSVTLTTDILSTSDLNSPDERLRFTIIRPPSRGRLECTDLPGVPVTSFTQLQLAGSKIRYVHTSLEEARLDSFEFQVTDGRNAVFRTFRVSITDVDNKRPVLSVHTLVLGQGTAKCITPFELEVEDQDTPPHLLRFSVLRGPVHGKILYNSTRSVTTFTKEDLRENLITYKHDGSNFGEDTIRFMVTDGTHTGFYVLPEMQYETSKPQVLMIRINLEKRGTLRLAVNRPASSLTVLKTGQLGFRFSGKVLRTVKMTQGKDVRSVDLIYRLIEPPRYGFISHTELNNTDTFTQADIDGMKLYYILLDGVNATTDVFTFTVEDKGETLQR